MRKVKFQIGSNFFSGFFHGISQQYSDEGPDTCAVVEGLDGRLHLVFVEDVQFLEKPTSNDYQMEIK